MGQQTLLIHSEAEGSLSVPSFKYEQIANDHQAKPITNREVILELVDA